MTTPNTPVRILIKTTIAPAEQDWCANRFSLLARHLASIGGPGGELYEVVSADRRETADGDDADLADLAQGRWDQLWLLATDVTGALTPGDAANIQAFRAKGGGVFLSRDHQDLGGASLTALGALGATEHFQTINPELDEARRCCDDLDTPAISWPNYHSGANGDLQTIEAIEPLHPILRRPSGEPISRLPSHPHEGAVGVPEALKGSARLVARGRSRITGSVFGLCVAVEEPGLGRAVADSSFHHVADYNWDPRLGCPSFVTEPVGDAVLKDPHALDDVHTYVANIAAWLARRI